MLVRRLRRNRRSSAIRQLVSETHLNAAQLIYPLFVHEDKTCSKIPQLGGMACYGQDDLLHQIAKSLDLNIQTIALFPVIEPDLKDKFGLEALSPNNLLNRTVRCIKREFPDICVMTDVALDPYTTHGHDGIYDDEEEEVLNDPTVEALTKMALLQAEAGSDMIAPSDMMDGRIKAIRQALDEQGFDQINIHAYAAKYASSFYGPFRETVGSKLKQGNKKSYQISPQNARQALLEAIADEQEGADILMVKPAGYYLDIIYRLRQTTHLPISAYQVSGEYAMIKAAALRGWIDEQQAIYESLIAIKRAGADMIISYAALDVARWLKEGVLDY